MLLLFFGSEEARRQRLLWCLALVHPSAGYAASVVKRGPSCSSRSTTHHPTSAVHAPSARGSVVPAKISRCLGGTVLSEVPAAPVSSCPPTSPAASAAAVGAAAAIPRALAPPCVLGRAIVVRARGAEANAANLLSLRVMTLLVLEPVFGSRLLVDGTILIMVGLAVVLLLLLLLLVVVPSVVRRSRCARWRRTGSGRRSSLPISHRRGRVPPRARPLLVLVPLVLLLMVVG